MTLLHSCREEEPVHHLIFRPKGPKVSRNLEPWPSEAHVALRRKKRRTYFFQFVICSETIVITDHFKPSSTPLAHADYMYTRKH